MSVRIQHIISFLFVSALVAVKSHAQPSLATSFMIGEERIYRDIKKTNLYYYIPFDYKLVTDGTGKPFFTLSQMRYTGTQTGGDAGLSKYGNLLQFKVAMDMTQQTKLATLKTSLKTINAAAELQMLPVRKFFSVLVFATTSPDEMPAPGDSTGFIKTSLADATDENASANNSYWNERTISIRLSNADAQLVEAALKNDQSPMSFSYAIYTAFVEKTKPEVSITGSGKLRKDVAAYFQKEGNPAEDTAQRITLVKADAIGLGVDIKRWPSLIQKVDINERVPARYALFDVYCYDFNNELRPDLFEKRVEIKAVSVTGADISTSYSFKQSRPDLYARSIRFAYAVKLDRPFYYRITEINNDGDATATEWIQRKEWSQVLDITSPPEKIIRPPVVEEQ